MNNPDTELVFPLRVIPVIIDSTDADWRALAEFVISEEADTLDQLGFVLTMARLAGCASCNSDSFRAVRGCTQCALQTVRRQHPKGANIRTLFEQNRTEVEIYLKNNV